MANYIFNVFAMHYIYAKINRVSCICGMNILVRQEYFYAIITLIMDIAVYGLIGYEGALALYEENRAFLDVRFPAFWIQNFRNRQDELQDYEGLFTRGQALAVAIRKGGLYGALWQQCEVLGTGCTVDMQNVPILQEVVEICECFDQDPYEIASKGAFLVAGENLAEKDIEGLTVIGRTTETKDRILLLGWDEKKNERYRRFLTPPARQEKDIKNRRGKNG